MFDSSTRSRTVVVKTSQDFEFPVETLVWNYLDGEHLEFVHQGYARPRILVLHGDVTLFISQLKVPGLPIRFRTTNLTFLPRFGEQITVTTLPWAISKTSIRVTPDGVGGSNVETEYEWFLPRMLTPLAPVLKRLIVRWNQSVNLEDEPLRRRRTFVLGKGFKDFHGMRSSAGEPRSTIRLPFTIPDDSPLFRGPFMVRTGRKVTIDFEHENLLVEQAPRT